MSNDYILPGELLALVVFWFGLPLLIGLLPIGWLFVSRGLFRYHTTRAFFALLLIISASVAIGLGIFVWSPPFLNVLGVHDIFLAGHYWPVLPLSFVVVAIVAPPIGWWALRVARPNTSVNRDVR